MEQMCIMCDTIFKTCEELKIHQDSHTGERRLDSSDCEKSFIGSGSLKTHRVNQIREKG